MSEMDFDYCDECGNDSSHCTCDNELEEEDE